MLIFWLILIYFLYSYKIENLNGARSFVVDLNISVCLEHDQPCVDNVAVLQKVLMPKVLCDWTNGYSLPGI